MRNVRSTVAMRGLITRQPQACVLTAADIPEGAPHPFRDFVPPITIEPLIEERWTNFTFFCASFVSGFVFFFGMII